MNTLGAKKIYIVDGTTFNTLAEAAIEFTRVLGLTMPWDGNLDTFNDFLRGGFGTPGEGFVLIWRHSDVSRKRLGHGETLLWLEETVRRCHPSNVSHIRDRIASARRGDGETLFDTLVEIIRNHRHIELRLE
jgi:hypothetical protein